MNRSTSAARSAALFLFCALAATCAPAAEGPPRIEIDTSGARPTIDVAGLPTETLRLLAGERSDHAWSEILRVSVGQDQPAMLGAWSVVDRRLRFTPMFPLDAGRPYHIVFTPPAGPPLSATLSLPARDLTPVTAVSNVFPTADVVPENQLRLYVHFSGAMGSRGGLDYIHLLDADGREVNAPFLPLDEDFWNPDHTRYTVFFDPGRVKRGIKPNRDLGPSLTEGKTYTLVVDAAWPDGEGRLLKQPFTRTFRVGPPDLKPLDPKTWRVSSPSAGSREPLAITFPEPLDHGLLLKAVSVADAAGQPVSGAAAVGDQELTWSFTPRDPWHAGPHMIVALEMLEDLAGNRIGRAFEVDQFERVDRAPEPERTTIPFAVR